MSLFGMMNWLYTWYKPRVDSDPEVLAREISDIFLRGVRGTRVGDAKPSNRVLRNGQTGNGRSKVDVQDPLSVAKNKVAAKASQKTGRSSRNE
jgi:hypothetical protein